jgi:hypothetical protein
VLSLFIEAHYAMRPVRRIHRLNTLAEIALPRLLVTHESSSIDVIMARTYGS